MKSLKAKLVLAAAALLLVGTSQSKAQGFYQPGFSRPYGTPCPPGQNLRTYTYNGPSYQSGSNFGGQFAPSGIGINGGWNNQTTQPQRSYSEQWCVPYQQPRAVRPDTMPRPSYQMPPQTFSTPPFMRR